MKKILVVNIGTEIGGIEKCLINFLKYLDTRNCYVDLLLWKPAGPLFSQIPKSVSVLDRLGVGSFKEICKIKSFKEKLERIKIYMKYKKYGKKGQAWKALPIREDEYDIAISYCQNGYSPYYVLDNVKASKKYMFYHHGSYEKSEKEYEYDKVAYLQFDKIITVSRANKNMLLKYFPELENRIEVIHNLIDDKSIIEKAKEPLECFRKQDVLKITTVGRLSAEKGQQFALKVAHALKNRGINYEWIFVGDGPEKEIDDKYVEENQLHENCYFVGSKENPYPYIQQADVYVQTSSVEADPTTIQEAKVLNKKIIASDIPAICECLEGVLVAETVPLDVDMFTKKIEDVLNNIKLPFNVNRNINTESMAAMDIVFGLKDVMES